MFGKICSYNTWENKVIIQYEDTSVTVEVINPYIVNFFAPLLREQRASKAVENLEIESCSIQVRKEEGYISINTEKLQVKIFDEFLVDIYDNEGNVLCRDYREERKPFTRRAGDFKLAEEEGHKLAQDSGEMLTIVKKMEEDMFFYGLGEKTGHLNKKGYHYKMWNTDDPSPHVESYEALYKSIPFFIAMKEKKAFGIFFDNTFETHFDMGKENLDYYYFSAVDGNLDYYFIYGPSIKEVVSGYTQLTGRTPLPQLWALGYHQSRWSYSPEDCVWEIAENFRKRDIPCDVIHFDIDYMDGYRVFTWDKSRFPNPEEFLAKLKEQGFKAVSIIDPGVKKDKGYKIYDEGLEKGYYATDKDGVTYVNRVWPGDSVYPDFTNEKVRKWWADNQKIMMDYGVSGIWNDMNEPASFNGPLPMEVMFNNDGIEVQHKEVHNVYGHYMSKATYEGIKEYTGKRPFVITRACYSGSQKYSTIWTGDNQSLWEHLRMSLPMLMNLGLSGMAFCGTDVGGFGFDCTPELLSRWVQVGAFTPLFRNHSAMNTRDQEPWKFDAKTEDINRKYIKLRYKLLPYIYDLMWNAEDTGLPVIRPLLLNYQMDSNTYEINDEFLCGDNILVAPIVEQGRKVRTVYLPEGDSWIDYWTKEVFQGGQYIIKEADLDVCPIYIKAGSVIPNYPQQNYIGEVEVKELILDLYAPAIGTTASYVHYQDDGESFEYRNGKYNLYEFTLENKKELTITISNKQEGYEKKYQSLKLCINNINPSEVSVDGVKVDFVKQENSIEFSVQLKSNILVEIR